MTGVMHAYIVKDCSRQATLTYFLNNVSIWMFNEIFSTSLQGIYCQMVIFERPCKSWWFTFWNNSLINVKK